MSNMPKEETVWKQRTCQQSRAGRGRVDQDFKAHSVLATRGSCYLGNSHARRIGLWIAEWKPEVTSVQSEWVAGGDRKQTRQILTYILGSCFWNERDKGVGIATSRDTKGGWASHFLSSDTKIPAQSVSHRFKNFLSRRGSQLNITMDYYVFFVDFPSWLHSSNYPFKKLEGEAINHRAPFDPQVAVVCWFLLKWPFCGAC